MPAVHYCTKLQAAKFFLIWRQTAATAMPSAHSTISLELFTSRRARSRVQFLHFASHAAQLNYHSSLHLRIPGEFGVFCSCFTLLIKTLHPISFRSLRFRSPPEYRYCTWHCFCIYLVLLQRKCASSLQKSVLFGCMMRRLHHGIGRV